MTVFHWLIFMYITCYYIFKVCFQLIYLIYYILVLTKVHLVNKALMKIDSKMEESFK